MNAVISAWFEVCPVDEIPLLGSRVVQGESGDIAVFRTATNEIFALRDKCPHKGGPLSQGMVHGDTVTCPMHGWKLHLANGEAVAPDKGCARGYPVKVEAGVVYISLD
jgi:nitrite reductase (NADH) small subunit